MNYAIILNSNKETKWNLEIPVCAYPLLKKPIIEYMIDALEKSNIKKISYMMQDGKHLIQDILKNRVEYMIEDEYFQEDGHTIILLDHLLLLDEEIISMLINKHQQNKNDCTILSKNHIQVLCLKNVILYDILQENNHLKNESDLTNLIELVSEKYKVEHGILEDSYKLTEITDLYTLSCVEEELRKDIQKKHMQNGVCIMNPNSTTISFDTSIESGTIIYPGCNIFGKTSIGHNCIVGPNTELNDAILEDDTKCIHSMVSDSKICKGATVGPFTQLRMHSVVGENNRVGNFVEMKNSTLGKNTNVAHLTYIGDTTCGDHVNWGCGTVTVNYDGKNKFKTTIGNDVFIGCNTNLIAPINIASNSFIAAGSTITEDLAEGDFAIARNKQVVKHNRAQNYGFKK
ncbi:MAG: hypothetical protein K2I42_06725 [Anaeroplasmataceae bacterium]|nr:hypothetical protein [Anaeroplasmataceae bacterium]